MAVPKLIRVAFLFLATMLTTNNAMAGTSMFVKVAVITHSVSTSIVARDICRRARWSVVKPREAEFVLVVCRSELLDPLNISYESFRKLDDAAKSQLNIAGSIYHIYTFQVNDDLSLKETSHRSFRAPD